MNVQGNDITIEIGASSEKAVEKINSFVSAFQKVKKIGTSKIENPMEGMGDYDASKLASSLLTVDKQIERTSQKIAELEDEMKRLATVQDPPRAGEVKPEERYENAKRDAELYRNVLDKLIAKRQELASIAAGDVKLKVNAADVDNATKKVTAFSKILSSLKRVAFYRAIRSIIKSITQAFTEGLEKAYLFSSGISGEGNRFAASLDRMKSAGNQMQGQLGSTFISLLAAVEPVLIALINLVTKAADAISQFLAAFTGKTYLKANATAAKFADTMARGGAAAKEWKNQLLGFDEINRLNEPSGGGGGGGANPLSGFAFEDTLISPEILNFVNELKDGFDEISKKVREVVENFKEFWNDPSLQKFVKLLQSISSLITEISRLANKFLFNGVLIPLGTFIDKIGESLGIDLGVERYLTDLRDNIDSIMVSVQKFVDDPSLANLVGIYKELGFTIADLIKIPVDGFFETWAQSARAVDYIGAKLGYSWKLEEKVRGWKKAFDEFDLREWFETKVAPWLEENKWNAAISLALIGFTGGFSLLALFDPIRDWWDEKVAPLFTKAKWEELGAKAIDGIKQGLSSITLPKFHFGWRMESYAGSFFGNQFTVNIPWPNLEFYAHGGFPENGDLFIANENGAEMVGSMGGRTAVANNDQIVEGIRQGVYDAVVAANGNGGGDVQVRVYLDSREIKAGQQRLNRAWGV